MKFKSFRNTDSFTFDKVIIKVACSKRLQDADELKLLLTSFSHKLPVQVQLIEKGRYGNSTRCGYSGYSGYSGQEMKEEASTLVVLCSLHLETAAGWPTFNSA